MAQPDADKRPDMQGVDPSRPDYHSYLLRLWHDDARTVWRASLQSTATEHIYHFTSAETLVAFLDAGLTADGDDGRAQGSDR